MCPASTFKLGFEMDISLLECGINRGQVKIVEKLKDEKGATKGKNQNSEYLKGTAFQKIQIKISVLDFGLFFCYNEILIQEEIEISLRFPNKSKVFNMIEK